MTHYEEIKELTKQLNREREENERLRLRIAQLEAVEQLLEALKACLNIT